MRARQNRMKENMFEKSEQKRWKDCDTKASASLNTLIDTNLPDDVFRIFRDEGHGNSAAQEKVMRVRIGKKNACLINRVGKVMGARTVERE
jgi:hypothetical protein